MFRSQTESEEEQQQNDEADTASDDDLGEYEESNQKKTQDELDQELHDILDELSRETIGTDPAVPGCGPATAAHIQVFIQ